MGVAIGFGTDSAVSPHGINGREFSLMTGLGMTPAARPARITKTTLYKRPAAR